MVCAYIGLGSNVGDRRRALERAREELSSRPGVAIVAESSVRETAPWGPVPQPDYLNQVVAIETALEPRELLETLLAIERTLGRDRSSEIRYGPRRLDLDLLVYGDATVSEPTLEVPHPRIAERRFVLEPLVELDADLVVPGQGRAADLLERLD